MLEGDEEVGLYPMLKALNQKIWHTFIDLELQAGDTGGASTQDRINVIINAFQVDNMFFFVRNFMSKL